MKEVFDRIIIGAGLYGLYSALYCGKKGEKVLVLERDDAPFKRATYINQARIHMGYHYPRSLTTAMKSAGYFRRFVEDFGFAVHSSFDQIYATSSQFSWTDGAQFKEFCRATGIKCEEVPIGTYFREGMCDGAFLTEEYTYDAHILRDYYVSELSKLSGVRIEYSVNIESIVNTGSSYIVAVNRDGSGSRVGDGSSGGNGNGNGSGHAERAEYETGFLLNATYASVNQILNKSGIDDLFPIKYELCEIILCNVSDKLKNVGLTVMDGPFFSIMPFGKTGYHSLTSVTFTPHRTGKDDVPTFECQGNNRGTWGCTPNELQNCNDCPNKPESAWQYMSHLAGKYILPEYGFEYVKSLYSMKPILRSSEVDDSRPTAVKVHSSKPTFISVLSGKINTVYDLDEYLEN